MKTTYPRVPFPLIVKATDGDVEAISQIVKHYRGYTSKRSLRRMTDEYGNSHMVIDETLRGRMETFCCFSDTYSLRSYLYRKAANAQKT
ncbi:TPA: helix-turn-helix domain-containing protein [Staphylococcus aureus]